MKKGIIIVVVLCVAYACIASFGGSGTNKDTSSSYYATNSKKDYSYSYKSNQSSFTNLYGTPTTICAHPGCTNYIASSGDTNCCTVHSRKCLECKKYIDEDALYCISCLSKAANQAYNNY